MTEIGFTPADSSLLFSKKDPEDVRLGEKVLRLEGIKSLEDLSKRLTDKTPGYVLAGYGDDEGISLSGGRLGAKEAPGVIRKHLYRTTFRPSQPLYDLGQVGLDVPLGERHERGRRACRTALETGHKWIGLGGGHDYGFADGSGFLDVFKDKSPVVINFDAHLDVRPFDKGLNSGTTFRRLLENHPGLALWEVGLLKACCSPHHVQWAKARGAKIHFWEDMLRERLSPEHIFGELLQRPEPAPVFISLDLDVLSSDTAPGCSQSWPFAMNLNWLTEALEFLQKNCQVKVFGFYEVSPPLDVDERTSKLAAQIIHSVLQD